MTENHDRSRVDARAANAHRASCTRLPTHLAPIRVQRDRPPQPLTRDQAARLLGRHARTLDRWARLGQLRTIDLGGTVRIPADEARRLLAHGRPWE